MDDQQLKTLDDTLTRLGRYFAALKKAEGDQTTSISDAHLLLLRRLQEDNGMRMTQIAQLLSIKAPAVSAMIDHLEEVGIVERTPDPDDRRALLIRLTPKGRLTASEVESKRSNLMERHLKALNERDLQDLSRITQKLLGSFDDASPQCHHAFEVVDKENAASSHHTKNSSKKDCSAHE